MLEKLLEKLGLSEKEAKVYLALLEMGQGTVQQIARKADIRRPTAYVILESLMKKSLVSSIERTGKTFFTSEAPRNLERLIRRQEDELQNRHQDLNQLLPEFEAIFNLAGKRPRVRFYEGEGEEDASYQYYYNNITKDDEIFSFTPYDDLHSRFPDYNNQHTSRRIEAGIWANIIYTNSSGPVPNFNNPKEKRRARFIAREKFPLRILFSIIPGKRVCLETLRERKMAVYIEDPEIADSMKAIWDLAWNAADKE